MINYSYNSESKILEAKATGIKKVDDIILHYKHLSETNSYPKILKVLIDSRQAKMDVHPDELKKIFYPLVRAIKTYDSLYEAFLVKNPYETAIATLFEKEYLNFKNFKFNIFSTKEAAIDWLQEIDA